jgi:hypothetical protein
MRRLGARLSKKIGAVGKKSPTPAEGLDAGPGVARPQHGHAQVSTAVGMVGLPFRRRARIDDRCFQVPQRGIAATRWYW